jgi:hypothetical protein
MAYGNGGSKGRGSASVCIAAAFNMKIYIFIFEGPWLLNPNARVL